MVSKQVGAILAIIGGVFYIIGSFLGAALYALLSGFAYGLSGGFPSVTPAYTAITGVAVFVLGLGIVSGILIIVGGALLNSEASDRRKAGGILAIVMMVVGALPALGGFLIGFLFVLIGSVIGLTYKPGPDIVIGTMSMPAPAVVRSSGSSSGFPGRTRFCIKCGLGLQDGAVFCGSCGAPVTQG